MSSRSLEKRHALVTGGGTGVGKAVALALADAGAAVTIVGRTPNSLEAVAKADPEISWIEADVTNRQSFAAACDEATKRAGPVSIAIANAGAVESVPFDKLTVGQWSSQIDVNLSGVFNTFQVCLEGMRDVGEGRMIAIASTAALKGYAYVSAYCAAKHGVLGLVRALALELATTGISVNAVCPGYTDTPMLTRALENISDKTGVSLEDAAGMLLASTPTKRFISPEEVAGTVMWLCSDRARSVTGQAIAVSGGEI